MRDWIKKNKELFGIGLVSLFFVIIVIGAYILNFRDVSISKEADSWGSFGSYIGGVLGPFFGFLSFIYLILALKISYAEKESIERREMKEEWRSLIEHAEKQIKDYIKSNVQVIDKPSASYTERDMEYLLSNIALILRINKQQKNKSEANRIILEISKDKSIENFYGLANLIEVFSTYLESYKRYLIESDPTIIRHYILSYLNLIQDIECIGLIESPDTLQRYEQLLGQKIEQPTVSTNE